MTIEEKKFTNVTLKELTEHLRKWVEEGVHAKPETWKVKINIHRFIKISI